MEWLEKRWSGDGGGPYSRGDVMGRNSAKSRLTRLEPRIQRNESTTIAEVGQRIYIRLYNRTTKSGNCESKNRDVPNNNDGIFMSADENSGTGCHGDEMMAWLHPTDE